MSFSERRYPPRIGVQGRLFRDHALARQMDPDWFRAIARSATAYTSAIFPATPRARNRAPKCRKGDSASVAPMSSSRRPIGRGDRLPDRHIRNRSAGAGSESWSVRRACNDRRRSSPARSGEGPCGRLRSAAVKSAARHCAFTVLGFWRRVWPRSGRSHRRRRQKSGASRRAAP
jgi:hypothetical protein